MFLQNKNRIKDCLTSNRRMLITAFAAVFVLGLLAHGYRFANLLLSHDSLNEMNLHGEINYAAGTVIDWKISLGRFVSPVYSLVFRGAIASPWLIGFWALVWLSLSVFFVCRIFSIDRILPAVIIAGIFSVNITVTAVSATYIHDLDSDMFGVFLAVLAVYFWYQGGKKSLIAVPLITAVLGIYQCLVSVAITLIIIKCALSLLNGDNHVNVLKKGLGAIGILIVSGAVYMLLVKLACVLKSVELGSGYNSLGNMFSGEIPFAESVRLTYTQWMNAFLKQPAAVSPLIIKLLNTAALVLVILSVIYLIIKNKIEPANIALIIILLAVMPFGMNISSFLDNGMAHTLMMFAFWLVYLIPVMTLCGGKNETENPVCDTAGTILKIAGVLCIAAILAADIRTANAAYIKKGLEDQSTLSEMTRVLSRLDATEGYVEGSTKVLFVGVPESRTDEVFADMYSMAGLTSTSPVDNQDFYKSYFKYIIGRPVNILSPYDYPEYDKVVAMTEETGMPVFPDDGYIEWYGDILVVKMSGGSNTHK